MPITRPITKILADLMQCREDIDTCKKLLGVLTGWQTETMEILSEEIAFAEGQQDSERRRELLTSCLIIAKKLRNSLLISLTDRGITPPVKWKTDIRR